MQNYSNIAIEQELDALTTQAQHVTLLVLLAVFSILIGALALVFGGAFWFVCQSFAIFRHATRFTFWYLGKFQGAWNAFQASQAQAQAHSQYQSSRARYQSARPRQASSRGSTQQPRRRSPSVRVISLQQVAW